MFKILDDDSSRSLSLSEFAKALTDFRITQLSGQEVERVFSFFDRDGDGRIDYDEFLRTMVGEMSERRGCLVVEAFRQFDRDGNGVVNIEDVKGAYNAGEHPEVKAGRKSEDDILYEFLDTFEQHYSLIVT